MHAARVSSFPLLRFSPVARVIGSTLNGKNIPPLYDIAQTRHKMIGGGGEPLTGSIIYPPPSLSCPTTLFSVCVYMTEPLSGSVRHIQNIESIQIGNSDLRQVGLEKVALVSFQ